MTENEKPRILNQDDWKRTQVRVPMPLYEDIVNYASANDISLNQAMLELMDKGLNKPKKLNRKIIFTEWNAGVMFETESPLNNEAVRMDCVRFMNEFFSNHPSYELVQLESKTRRNLKGHEIITGIRIWYTYPA